MLDETHARLHVQFQFCGHVTMSFSPSFPLSLLLRICVKIMRNERGGSAIGSIWIKRICARASKYDLLRLAHVAATKTTAQLFFAEFIGTTRHGLCWYGYGHNRIFGSSSYRDFRN